MLRHLLLVASIILATIFERNIVILLVQGAKVISKVYSEQFEKNLDLKAPD